MPIVELESLVGHGGGERDVEEREASKDAEDESR